MGGAAREHSPQFSLAPSSTALAGYCRRRSSPRQRPWSPATKDAHVSEVRSPPDRRESSCPQARCIDGGGLELIWCRRRFNSTERAPLGCVCDAHIIMMRSDAFSAFSDVPATPNLSLVFAHDYHACYCFGATLSLGKPGIASERLVATLSLGHTQ
eukprot:6608364-Pyramimonas_sp.AAC.1